ncbi:MAG TPA: ParB/RepB/Spo0J family partition protein [Gammaproteobacteria bacterium]|nr:ParB/RepB/Spo0J family partition protein [Gammaproteobacteria bacterium]
MTMKRRGLGRGLDALIGATTSVTLETAKAEKTLRQLPIDQIQRSPFQPRVSFNKENLQELADSIRQQGVLQPVVVRPKGEGFELVAGERRWRAAQLAGLQEIPAVVKELPDEAAAAIALIENIQREDLNPLEEASALQRLVDRFTMTHQQIAEAVGRSRVGVTNMLRLLELANPVKQWLQEGKLNMGHARALLSLAPARQIELGKMIVSRGLSVRAVEQMAQGGGTQDKPAAGKSRKDPDVARLEQSLADQLGARVEIQHSRDGKGKVLIHYSSLEQLEGILNQIRDGH